MPSVDKRVVQMTFDKGNFESAVQSVMNTLDKLKNKLNFNKANDAFNNISAASKEVDLSYLANSVDQIGSRFTNLGIVGMSVLNNLTNTAVNAGKSLLNSIVSPIVEGGKRRALNIEAAKFQIEGLGYTWEEVYGDIDYAVSGTAYGLDAAAKAAGQLLASSVQVGPEMKSALRGISGVAAMTNSEYEDIAHVFTTVAGNGKLMANELNRLSARGINAAATLGKHLGKTEAEVREMVKKGQIDFNLFAEAMDSAFGEHAKDANKTFTGALSNMKAALSRIGAEFATPAYEHMRDVLNSLRLVANQVKVLLGPLVTSASEGMRVVANYLTTSFDRLTESLKSDGAQGAMIQFNRIVAAVGQTLWNLFNSVMSIVKPIAGAFKDAFGGTLLEILARAAEGIASFTESLQLSASMESNLRKTFTGVFTILAALFDILSRIAGFVATTFFRVFGNVFEFVLEVLLRITGFFGDVISGIQNFIGQIKEMLSYNLLIDSLGNIWKNFCFQIEEAIYPLKQAALAFMDKGFAKALEIFENMAPVLETVNQKIFDLYLFVVYYVDGCMRLEKVQAIGEKVSNTFKKIRDNSGHIADFVKNSFVTAFDKAKDAIKNFIGILKDLINKYVDVEGIKNGFAEFGEFVANAFNNSKDIFEFMSELFKGIVDRIRELTSENFNNLLDNFAKLRDRIGEVIGQINTLEGVKSALKHVGDFFGEFASTSGGFLGKVQQKLQEFVDWVKTKIEGITLGDIIAGGVTGSFMVFILSLSAFIFKAKDLVQDWGKVSKEVANIPKNINKVIKSFDRNANYDKFKERIKALTQLVGAIALLAGSLMLLAGVDPARLITAGVVLGGLLTLMVVLTNYLGDKAFLGKHAATSLGAAGSMMLMLAGSLGILAIALRIVSNIKLGDIAKSVLALTFVMAELVVASIAISRYAGEATIGAGVILGLAGAILMLSGSIVLLSLIPVENLFKAITALSILLVAISGAAALAGVGGVGSAGTLIALAASVAILVGTLKLVAMMSTGEVVTGLARLIIILGLTVAAFKLLSLGGKHVKAASVAVLGISAALMLIAIAIKMLGNISTSEIANALSAMYGIIAIFGMMALITNLAGANGGSAAKAIAAMSASMILIAFAIAVLAKVDPAGLARATLAIDSIIGMFAILVASTYLVKEASKTIQSMAIAIGILAALMVVMSLVDPKNLHAAAMAIDSLILCFTILVAASGLMKRAEGQLLVLAGVVAAIGTVVLLLTKIDADGAAKVAFGLGILMVGLSAVMVACSVAGFLGAQAFTGIAVLAAVFGAIVGLIAVIATINQLCENHLAEFLSSAIPTLEAVGQAIGSFFGSIVGSFLSSAAAGLEEMAKSLNSFMSSFIPFIESAKTIDGAALEGVQTMIAMVLALAAADFVNAITSLITGGQSGSSLDTLSEQLPKFGEALRRFSQSMTGVDTGSLKNAAEAGKALAEMAGALPREGGWVDNIFGTSDMGKFGEQLVAFGGALKAFGDAVGGADIGAINGAIEPTRSLVQLGNELPRGGDSVISWFAGSQDFGKFGENLVAYGTALKEFSEVIGGNNIDYDAISKIMQPTKDLIEVAKTIENIGGLGDVFSGADDLGTFGANLATFGGTFSLFSEKIKDIDDSSLTKMKSIAEVVGVLAEASSSLPETGLSFASVIFGDESLSNLGTQLPNLGYGLSEFAKSMDGVNTEALINSVDAIKAVVEIANVVPELGGLAGILSGSSDKIQLMGTQLPILGNGLAAYSESVSGLNLGKIEESVTAAKVMREVSDQLPNVFEAMALFVSSAIGMGAFPLAGKAIGRGLKAFSDELQGIDTSGLSGAAQAASALADASTKLPGFFTAINNFISYLTGNTFADCCRQLAAGIKAFANELSGVSLENIGPAVDAVSKLAELSQNSGNFGGLTTIGTTIKTFGENYKAFYDNFAGNTDVDKLNSVLEFVQKLTEVVSEVKSSFNETADNVGKTLKEIAEDMVTSFTNTLIENQQRVHDEAFNMANQINIGLDEALSESSSKFDGVGEQLIERLVAGIQAGGDSVGQAILFIMQWAIDTLNGKQGEFEQCGVTLINFLSNGMKSMQATVVGAVDLVITAARNKVDSFKETFRSAGSGLMKSLANGIRSAASEITSAVNSVVRSAASSVNTNGLKSVGENLTLGMARGIEARKQDVIDSASRVASAAVEAVKKITAVQSPSRVFHRIGEFFTIGLANGMIDSVGRLKSSAMRSAEIAVNAMAVAAETIEEKMEDLEYEPKITPVVDTSMIAPGLQGVNSIFGSSYGLGMANRTFNMMGANALAAMQNQNGMYNMANMLEEKIDNLNDSIIGLYDYVNFTTDLVIDGKQFARATARPMNRALGSISKRGGIS